MTAAYQKSVEDKNLLTPDPNTADIVQSIFYMKLHGMSTTTIAAELNKLNVPSPLSYKRKHDLPHPHGGFSDKNDARWSATTVLRILKDENYTGTLVQGRQQSLSYKTRIFINLDESEWSKTRNTHPSIISIVDYEAVQRTLSIDTRTAPEHSKVHIFSGMLTCGCCGGSMTRKIVKHKAHHYIYYRCRTGKGNGCHLPSAISESALVPIVTNKVKERITDIGRLSACVSETLMYELLQDERNQQITAYDMKIRELHRYKFSLLNSRTVGFLNDAEYQEFHDFYDRKIILLAGKLSALRKEPCFTASQCRNYFEWTQSFLQLSNMKYLDRFALVQTVKNICVLGTKEIHINFAYQAEFEELLRCSASGGHVNGEKKS